MLRNRLLRIGPYDIVNHYIHIDPVYFNLSSICFSQNGCKKEVQNLDY